METSLRRLLERGAAHQAALGAPGRQDLTHAELRALVDRTLSTLNGMGIGRNDRLAIVLPNGPEMAACFVAAACGVATAPLNPAYRGEEFEFYLADLKARALVVEQGSTSPAVEVAQRMGVPVIELVPELAAGAGSFTLQCAQPPGTVAAHPGLAQPGDVSMVLHTSGTTSRPKIVPLSQANLCASAQHAG
jgi:acyl-CoA synthetase (AMP-forming)/AMP-acid ligase II